MGHPLRTDVVSDNFQIAQEGTATKLTPRSIHTMLTVFTITTQDTTFALKIFAVKTAELNLCIMTQTEHLKLFILETQRERTFKAREISINNLDIVAYVKSKFVYVEKHIKTQLTKLYTKIMEQKCALEKQILQNALSLSSIAPDEMAFRIMKTLSYTAVTAGELINLIKCIPVDCRVRQDTECHNELPVIYQNQSYFLALRSRILIKTGTQRDCNELLPIMFKIHDS